MNAFASDICLTSTFKNKQLTAVCFDSASARITSKRRVFRLLLYDNYYFCLNKSDIYVAF